MNFKYVNYVTPTIGHEKVYQVMNIHEVDSLSLSFKGDWIRKVKGYVDLIDDDGVYYDNVNPLWLKLYE